MKIFFQIITNIKNKFATEKKGPLGRWGIIYCDNKLRRKIELSNEDHCGPCGEYAVKRKELLDKGINIKGIDDKNKNNPTQ